ncbi:MAG: ABC-2 family transporter protein [Ruminococcus bromii]|uniref:ABC transporter permease n=1 Tax=Ruminococcus sp. YE282 TaxID=3158780 RepID=UPI00087E621D|nr:ABC-2 family transporter protein [Ruminococcus bromii]MCI7211012.1 ABC-2 family transporter protein [Ruminococcus bromii]MDD6433992.1 ABC-2 family transporter protein [Ruminococcus bromii]MDY4084025.1 ABC-2 family transporter protein [Ruminococcus bromii]MDY4711459.1 ABC-2 family transporter protein [Ruminococcus bromii]
MKQIKRMLRIHRIFIAQELKRMMEYKGDFIVGIIGFLMVQCSNLLFLWIIFSQIPDLMGWTVNEIIFIYGFSLIPKGIDHLLFDNLWSIGHFTVRKGDFDKYLTRPINTLFHVMVEKVQIDALGELLMGIALVCVTLPSLSIEWTAMKIILGIAVIPFATLIYTGIKIATSAIAFWTKRSGNIIYMFYMVNDFAKYPATIYNNAVKWIITYVIPFAFTSYYPAKYILTGDNPLYNIGLSVVISIVLMVIGIIIWNKGIGAYESAGS